MRILLVQPAPFESGRVGLETALWLSEPVALTSLAAMVADRYEVRILDLRLERQNALPEVLAEFQPQLVGISCMTTDAYQAQAVAYTVKSTLGKSVYTIVGGHHPTLAPEEHNVPSIDAICIGEGEETFAELAHHLENKGRRLPIGIAGLTYRVGNQLIHNSPRAQTRELDTFPAPARHLLEPYRGRYFFGSAQPLASLQTSRGCAFDCNFCAIWEFYERKVRFLSAGAICDRLETMPEKFVFFLDDNFLSHAGRLEELVEEIGRRKIKKYWMIQGRSDFIAQHPDLMRRLRDAGLMMVLSGYESNDEDTLAALQKDNTRRNNLAASSLLHKLGIFTTGIFMSHPDWTQEQFDRLYESINDMRITAPLVVIHTPLPGTQAYRQQQTQLLTQDTRLYDLLHAVVPTRLPRAEFYRHYARWNQSTMQTTRRSLTLSLLARRPRLTAALLPGLPAFRHRLRRLRRVIEDPESYLRDEFQIIANPSHRAERCSPLRALEMHA